MASIACSVLVHTPARCLSPMLSTCTGSTISMEQASTAARPAPLTRQEVITLPLAPGVRSQLLGHGITTLQDLLHLTEPQLAEAANITVEDAAEVLHLATGAYAMGSRMYACPKAVPASQLLPQHAQHAVDLTCSSIITFCKELDDLLGGGVACGQVLELCGVPGVGKTQLGIQLAVDVQIPRAFGGLQGAAVCIDSEGGFMVDRVVDVATAATKHVSRSAKQAARNGNASGLDPNRLLEEASQFTLDLVLENIHIFRVHDAAEQLACLHLMPEFLEKHPEVRLLVIDSVTFHFRADFTDLGARTRTLTGMAQACMQLAEQYNIAVVFTNQVTTRVLGESLAQLVPALGESWGQAASTRVVLHWKGNERQAFLFKSPHLPCGTASYFVTADGIRGKPRSKPNQGTRPSEQQQQVQQPPQQQMGQQQQR